MPLKFEIKLEKHACFCKLCMPGTPISVSLTSVAEVQFRTGRTERNVQLWFQFQFGLGLSVLVHSLGMRIFLGTAFELV